MVNHFDPALPYIGWVETAFSGGRLPERLNIMENCIGWILK